MKLSLQMVHRKAHQGGRHASEDDKFGTEGHHYENRRAVGKNRVNVTLMSPLIQNVRSAITN